MKTKTKKTTPKARVTSVSISRLYNLGNYQNVKYDLTAEVPKGAGAKRTLLELMYILQMLKPTRKPHCWDEATKAEKKLPSELSEREKMHLQEWQEECGAYRRHCMEREEAVSALDTLGGVSFPKDAKLTWEDRDDDY